MASVGFVRPYTAADRQGQDLSQWNPVLGSPATDYHADRDVVVARQRDVIRNSGWGSRATSCYLDNVIGSGFRLSAKPDYLALGLEPEWAQEFSKQVEGRWRLFAEDPDNWIDATRQNNFNGLLGLAFRHDFVDGESFAISHWIDKPNGRYATTIQIVDPDRLSNPQGLADSVSLKAGIEKDNLGAPIAYHFRKGHPADVGFGIEAYTWVRVSRELPNGRRQVLHTYDKERAEQVRGISLMAPIIERLKMIDKYDKIELQAALLNAIFAAFIESPFDHELLDGLLSGENSLNKYQEARSDYHEQRGPKLQGVTIPKLFPGEKFAMQNAARPAAQFADFERACLHNVAAGLNLAYPQLSQDWSSVNYSSARAALLEVWKHFLRRRQRFVDQFATPVFILWLEEAIDRGDIVLPDNAPDFYAAKAAYCRVKWIGPARGWVDPVKEMTAAQMRMDSSLSTLEDECAEQGKDYQEVLHQRAREIKEMDDLGLPRPEWADKAPVIVEERTDAA